MGETFHFILAKLLQVVLTPQSIFFVALLLAFVLLHMRRGAVWGRRVLGLALLGYVALAMLPTGSWALAALENRFPIVDAHVPPVAGIMVLGGAMDPLSTFERGQAQLNSSAERLTAFIALARRHPQAKLLFTGGIGRVFNRHPESTDVQAAKVFFADMDFDDRRVVYEDRSRNTTESAVMAHDLMTPAADERWVLITSARHMPRAVGLFRHAGWDVVAHPVDFLTRPGEPSGFWPSWPGGFGTAKAAAHEWGGLLVAWLRGRTDALFPAPQSPASQGR